MNLTNNQIVEDVARNYQIRQLVRKMIDYSIKDDSDDDLTQYIYEYLLTYDNIKLNSIYQSNKLRNFISQIILRQRDGGVDGNNTIYQNYLRIRNSNETYYNRVEYDTEAYDYTVDIIIEYIDSKLEMIEGKEYTSPELKSILAFTLLKKYILSDLTQITLAKTLKMSRITISNLLKFAKKDIKVWWDTTGSDIEKNIFNV